MGEACLQKLKEAVPIDKIKTSENKLIQYPLMTESEDKLEMFIASIVNKQATLQKIVDLLPQSCVVEIGDILQEIVNFSMISGKRSRVVWCGRPLTPREGSGDFYIHNLCQALEIVSLRLQYSH